MVERNNKKIFGTFGIHPHSSQTFNQKVEEEMRELLKMEKVVVRIFFFFFYFFLNNNKWKAVGEMGLDYFYSKSDPKIQRIVFEKQLQIAEEINKPIVIHTREAEEDTLKVNKFKIIFFFFFYFNFFFQ